MFLAGIQAKYGLDRQ